MTAPPVTEERDLYRTAFGDFAKRLAGSEPAWLGGIRTAAMARFAELGFPKPRDEEWKYTNVAPIVRTAFRPATDDDAAGVTEDDVAPFRLVAGGPEAVFLNGRFAPELSSLGELPPGVEVLSLGEALRHKPEVLEAHLARVATDGATAFAALNTAFLEDGAVVLLAPNAVARDPIHLVFFSTNAGRPTVSYPRNLIVAGRSSQATVVESYVGADAHTYFTCAVTEVVAGEGANVSHYVLQDEGERAFHVGLLAARQERDSLFRDDSTALGALLARRDVRVLLAAEGADCELLGLFLADGQQHTDTHTFIDHARPHGTSRELYKGILDGKARGVFTGKIVVRKDAQKTDSRQTNKNLLLSREALVDSTPALEILADDVKCKHGSTTGQLDPTALFYLRSRGLSEPQARALLTYAFASDLVAKIEVAALRSRVESHLRSQLPGGPKIEEAAV